MEARTGRLGCPCWNAAACSPAGQSIARLRCSRPVFAFAGDRFIVRDGSGRVTLAGGVVLDPDPPRRSFRHAAARRFLERRAANLADPAVAVAALLERDHAVPRASLWQKSTFSGVEIAAAASRLVQAGTAVSVGLHLADAAWWQTFGQRLADLIDTAHREHPERIGPRLGELRASLGRGFPNAELFDGLVASLTEKGEMIRVGTSLRRAAHRPRLPANLQSAGARLRAVLAAKPFEPPSRQELAPDGPSRQALRFLFDSGEALELGPDLVLLEENFRRMKTIVVRSIRAAGPATTSELRQILGTTRRVLIPFLEHLDREGLTHREGDRRALR